MGGNHRFRLSDMIPNAWFYKLREIGRAKNQPTSKKKKHHPSSSNQQLQQQCNPRKSYYFTRELHPPNNNLNSPEVRKPSKQKTTTRRISAQPARNRGAEKEKTPSSSVSAGCSCRTTLDSVWTKEENFSTESESSPDPEFRTDRVLIPSELSSFDEMLLSSTTTTTTTDVIVIDIDKNSLPRKDDKLQNYKSRESREQQESNSNSKANYRGLPRDFTELQLRPIITKPPNKIKFLKEQKRSGINSPGGVKLRVNSPKIANRRVQSRGQSHSRKSLSSSKMTSSDKSKSISGSFAIAKSSFNPQKDFRESMVEMIVENNIRESKDLEELLACYLSLNSDQYHEIIIKVFKQIWFDLTQRS